MLSIYDFLITMYRLVKRNIINGFYTYTFKSFCTFVETNNKFLIMMQLSLLCHFYISQRNTSSITKNNSTIHLSSIRYRN